MPLSHEPQTSASSNFAKKCVIACAIAVALVTLAMFLWYSVYILLLVFAGILIAILLRALSDLVSGWTGMPHLASLIVVILLIFAIVGITIWLSAPRLVAEAASLAEELPKAAQGVLDKFSSTRLGRLLVNSSGNSVPLVPSGNWLSRVTGIVSTTIGIIVSTAVVLFVGLFIALNPRMYVRGVVHLIPPAQRTRGAEVIGALGYTLKWWLIGQAIDMLVIGVATTIGLMLLNVPMAIVLGLLAGLFNFIPNFGPLISLVPAVLITLPTDPSKAAYVVLLFLVLQTLEGYVLMPLIQGRAVSLPPAVTIVAQLLMGILAGGVGLALAAPLAAAALVMVKMLYVEDLLGDRIKTPADSDAREEVHEVKRAAAEVARQQK